MRRRFIDLDFIRDVDANNCNIGHYISLDFVFGSEAENRQRHYGFWVEFSHNPNYYFELRVCGAYLIENGERIRTSDGVLLLSAFRRWLFNNHMGQLTNWCSRLAHTNVDVTKVDFWVSVYGQVVPMGDSYGFSVPHD